LARGTQHRKRRTETHAGVAPSGPPKKPKKTKTPKHDNWEDQLFFSRLRHQAKPVFIFLALVFGVGFVVFGVGTGAGGIGDVLDFSGSSASGPSRSSLEKKTQENPKDPEAWRELATKLQQDDDVAEAIVALTRYTALKPKDESGVQELGGLYLRQADEFANEYFLAQTQTQALAPGQQFAPPAGSPFAQAFQNPLSSAVTQVTQGKLSDAYTKYLDTQRKAVVVYKKLVALRPTDATNQYRLAQVAQSAGDSATAIAAYKKFLSLAPNDALAPAAKKALKELTAAPAAAVGGG
jgi:DNA-binding SARP family transcriptional activator